jgi:hypothetical protein
MHRTLRSATRASVVTLSLLALITTIPTPGRAGSVPLATEILMANQEANSLFIGDFFGVDSKSPLNFTSIVDTGGQFFTYSLIAGSNYSGQPISLTSSGMLDAAGTVWTFSSSGTFGTTSWSSTGTALTSTSGDITDDKHDYDFKDNNNRKVRDIHLDSRTINGKSSTDSGFKTDATGTKVPGSDFDSTDTMDGTQWTFNLKPKSGMSFDNFPIVSTGFSPTDGGVGSFTTTIIPEPSSLTLIVLGALGILGLRLRGPRRHSSALIPRRH